MLKCFCAGICRWLVVVAALAVFPAHAAAPAAEVRDPALEKRVAALSEQLRCLVCQNQSLADSSADLALDLKNQVREQLAAGKSEQQVVDFMVARYGDFVLYRPPVKTATWLLWFGPFVLLVVAVAALGLRLMRRRQQETLPDAERQRAAELLAGAGTEGNKP